MFQILASVFSYPQGASIWSNEMEQQDCKEDCKEQRYSINTAEEGQAVWDMYILKAGEIKKAHTDRTCSSSSLCKLLECDAAEAA